MNLTKVNILGRKKMKPAHRGWWVDKCVWNLAFLVGLHSEEHFCAKGHWNFIYRWLSQIFWVWVCLLLWKVLVLKTHRFTVGRKCVATWAAFPKSPFSSFKNAVAMTWSLKWSEVSFIRFGRSLPDSNIKTLMCWTTPPLLSRCCSITISQMRAEGSGQS